MNSNKTKEAAKLSKDIISYIEEGRLPLSKICLKVIRLARLINDSD